MRIEARVHGDDTTRLSVRLADGALVESVIILAPDRGRGRRRRTLCLSTQVGCRMGCVFCATGRMGFVRQLAAEEIAGQVRLAEGGSPAGGRTAWCSWAWASPSTTSTSGAPAWSC
jgi:adenine C2-methylase RlmN of 23S rRNA A2503 and tRNA A37